MMNTVYGKTLQESFSLSKKNGEDGVRLVDALNSWLLTDNFIAGNEPAGWQYNYRYRGYGKYVDIVDMFGWDAVIGMQKEINEDFIEFGVGYIPRVFNFHNLDDRILRLSRHAGVDLRPLTHLWGREPEDQATLEAKLVAEGSLPSVHIYDRLIAYRSTIPMNQAEFDDFWSHISFNLMHEDGWDDMKTNFDPARGVAAAARVDEIIGYYFPDGRPTSAAGYR